MARSEGHGPRHAHPDRCRATRQQAHGGWRALPPSRPVAPARGLQAKDGNRSARTERRTRNDVPRRSPEVAVAASRAWLVTRAAVVVCLAALLAGSTVVTPDGSLVRAAPPASAPAAAEPDVAAAVRGSTTLALALYQRLGSGDENLVASPSSLATVLAMALPGARGQTADEIARVLHATLDPGRLAVVMGTLDAAIGQRASAGNAAELRVSNALWSQRGYTIQPAFLELLAGAFRSGVHQADFIRDTERARLAINALV